MNELAQVIEVAVAPVFLLTGIAAFLNVMTGRLGRIVDRARKTEKLFLSLEEIDSKAGCRREIRYLWKRTKIINLAIVSCAVSGFLVCAVIGSLFAADLWKLDLHIFVVLLFVAALFSLTTAIGSFLIEVTLSTKTLKMSVSDHTLK